MPEIRINPLTEAGVIVASERAHRPFSPKDDSDSKFVCPFCVGNEEQTPLPTDIVYFPGTNDWAIRSVPNRFPAMKIAQPWSEIEFHLETNNNQNSLSWIKQAAIGHHEVIIESPQHVKRCGLLGIEQWQRLIRFYAYKIKLFYNEDNCNYIQLFKNQGSGAGASLEHIHSQIISMPFIPLVVKREIAELERYAHQTGRNMWVDLQEKELSQGKRVVEISDHFVAYCPFISRFSGETWIVPRKPRPDIENASDEILDDLGAFVSRILYRLEDVLLSMNIKNDSNIEQIPSFNIVYRTAPRIEGKIPELFCWRMEIIPRLNAIAGFELGTGYFINVLPPEEFAVMLRDKMR